MGVLVSLFSLPYRSKVIFGYTKIMIKDSIK